MESLKQMRNIYELYLLIKNEHTGTSYQLAETLKVSRRSVMYYIAELRDLGAEIGYDYVRNTFFFQKNFEMIFEFNIKI